MTLTAFTTTVSTRSFRSFTPIPTPSMGRFFPYHEFIDAQDAQQTQDYIDSVLVRSIINTGVDVRSDDQLLTLSTCSYEFKDARFVVVARKVRKGESASVDTSAAVMNPNPLYPDVWYQLFGGKQTGRDTAEGGAAQRFLIHTI